MPGPGEYVPDATEGITRVEDLPKPRIHKQSRNFAARPCPHVSPRPPDDTASAYTHTPRPRRPTLRPTARRGRYILTASLPTLWPPLHRRPERPLHSPSASTPVASNNWPSDSLRRTLCPTASASWHLWRDHRVFVPYATMQNWVEAAGEKIHATLSTDYFNEALTDFSGYLAIDEVYDGGRFASCRSSITAAIAAQLAFFGCWNTTQPTPTSARFWGISRPNWNRVNSRCGYLFSALTCVKSRFPSRSCR